MSITEVNNKGIIRKHFLIRITNNSTVGGKYDSAGINFIIPSYVTKQ